MPLVNPFRSNRCPYCLEQIWLGDCQLRAVDQEAELSPRGVERFRGRLAVRLGQVVGRLVARCWLPRISGPGFGQQLIRRICPICQSALPLELDQVDTRCIAVAGNCRSHPAAYISWLAKSLVSDPAAIGAAAIGVEQGHGTQFGDPPGLSRPLVLVIRPGTLAVSDLPLIVSLFAADETPMPQPMSGNATRAPRQGIDGFLFLVDPRGLRTVGRPVDFEDANVNRALTALQIAIADLERDWRPQQRGMNAVQAALLVVDLDYVRRSPTLSWARFRELMFESEVDGQFKASSIGIRRHEVLEMLRALDGELLVQSLEQKFDRAELFAADWSESSEGNAQRTQNNSIRETASPLSWMLKLWASDPVAGRAAAII